MASSFDEIAPAGYAWRVTPSDSSDLAMPARALYVCVDGDVTVMAFDPAAKKLAPVTFPAMIAGSYLMVKTTRVMQTGTTATINALA